MKSIKFMSWHDALQHMSINYKQKSQPGSVAPFVPDTAMVETLDIHSTTHQTTNELWAILQTNERAKQVTLINTFKWMDDWWIAAALQDLVQK